MDAEALRAEPPEFPVGLRHLVVRHAVFGLARVIHDAVGGTERPTRVIAAADGFRHARRSSFKNATCVRSSRLMIAPSFFASLKSSGGVSLEENMISAPYESRHASESISSV